MEWSENHIKVNHKIQHSEQMFFSCFVCDERKGATFWWRELITCTTETNEMEDPVNDGGLDNLELGLAEYAEGDAERTFNTYTS